MIDLTLYTKSYIEDQVSADVKKVLKRNNHTNLDFFQYEASNFQYEWPIRLIASTVNELFREIGESITIRLSKFNLDQAEVYLLKNNPTNPNNWPYSLREETRRVNQFRFSALRPDEKKPLISVCYIPKGYSGINSIGQESLDGTLPFKRVEAATQLLKQDNKHRHAMLQIGPNHYLYVTNQWSATLMFAMYSCMLLLFKNLLTEEASKKAEDLALNIFTENLHQDTLIHKLADIIVDPKAKIEDFKRKIQGIEHNLRVKEKQQYELQLKDTTNVIHELETQIAELWSKHSFLNRQIDYRNASTEIADESNALAEFILRSPEIVNQEYNPETQVLGLTIVNELEYYERDAFISSIRNKDSRWWDSVNFSLSTLTALIICFLTEKYSIIAKSSVNINFTEKTVDRNISSTALSELMGYLGIQQPHIMGISCFGSNRNQISAGMGTGNYIGSVAQTIAACKNMNMTDRMAIGKLLEHTNSAIIQGKPFIKNNRTGEILDYANFYSENEDKIKVLFPNEYTAKTNMTKSKEEIQIITELFDKEEDNE